MNEGFHGRYLPTRGFGRRPPALSWLPVCQRPRLLGGFRVWQGVGQRAAAQCGGFCLKCFESPVRVEQYFFPPNTVSVLSGEGRGM